jgi:hypothetical protein
MPRLRLVGRRSGGTAQEGDDALTAIRQLETEHSNAGI